MYGWVDISNIKKLIIMTGVVCTEYGKWGGFCKTILLPKDPSLNQFNQTLKLD